MTSPLAILDVRTVELNLDACRARVGAIYFLIDNDEIVYVGQTMRLIPRIAIHLGGGPHSAVKSFDRVRFFTCDATDLDRYEGALIRALRPRYSRRAPAWRGQDNDTLRELGLPTLDDEKANAEDWHRSVYQPLGPLTVREKEHRFGHRERTKQRDRAHRLFAGIEAACLAQRSALNIVVAGHESIVGREPISVSDSVHASREGEAVRPETHRNAAKGAA